MKNKKIHIEIMRIIAIFFVIYNHTGRWGFLHHLDLKMGGITYFIYLFVAVFCKVSVPLFLMISGALLIRKKDEEIRVLLKNRVIKVIVVLLIISLLHYIHQLNSGNDSFDVVIFFRTTLCGQWSEHLWYMYMFLAYLICLPLLRVLASNMKKEHYCYVAVITVILKLLPVIEYLVWEDMYFINGYLKNAWIVSDLFVFPLLGHFFENILDIQRVNIKRISVMWGINVASTVMICGVTYYKAKLTGDFSEMASQTFLNTITIISAPAMYVTIKWLFNKIKLVHILETVFGSIGGCVFGIYLFHELIKGNYYIQVVWNYISHFLEVILGINHLLAVGVYCIYIMMIGYFVVWFIKKIPFINKFI